jgi:hypothetical protein
VKVEQFLSTGFKSIHVSQMSTLETKLKSMNKDLKKYIKDF